MQTIDIRHDQVLEDDRGLHGVGHGQSPDRVLAKVQDNITLRIQHAPDGLADDGLVVDQQNRHGSGIRPVGQLLRNLRVCRHTHGILCSLFTPFGVPIVAGDSEGFQGGLSILLELESLV